MLPSRFGRAPSSGAAASHARAQTTRTEHKCTQAGIVRRVELEKLVAVAARSLGRLQFLAERDPMMCTSDARMNGRGGNAGSVHGASQRSGRGAVAATRHARAMG